MHRIPDIAATTNRCVCITPPTDQSVIWLVWNPQHGHMAPRIRESPRTALAGNGSGRRFPILWRCPLSRPPVFPANRRGAMLAWPEGTPDRYGRGSESEEPPQVPRAARAVRSKGAIDRKKTIRRIPHIPIIGLSAGRDPLCRGRSRKGDCCEVASHVVGRRTGGSDRLVSGSGSAGSQRASGPQSPRAADSGR